MSPGVRCGCRRLQRRGSEAVQVNDEFIARQAWLYFSIVAGAYFISRGLAKSGSREPYTEGSDERDRS